MIESLYNINEILEKKTPAPADIVKIFYKKIFLKRNERFSDLDDKEFSKRTGLPEKTLREMKPSTLERHGTKTAKKIALKVQEGDLMELLTTDEAKVYRKFLESFKEVKDKTPFINEIIYSFGNPEEVLELITFLYSVEGLRKDHKLSPTQESALNKMKAYSFINESRTNHYSIKETEEVRFDLNPLLVNLYWKLLLKKSDVGLRKKYLMINEVNQNEVLVEDVEEIITKMKEVKEAFDKAVEKRKQNPNKKRVSIGIGRIFTGFERPISID